MVPAPQAEPVGGTGGTTCPAHVRDGDETETSAHRGHKQDGQDESPLMCPQPPAFLEPTPRSLVTAQTTSPLQPQGTHDVCLIGYGPTGLATTCAEASGYPLASSLPSPIFAAGKPHSAGDPVESARPSPHHKMGNGNLRSIELRTGPLGEEPPVELLHGSGVITSRDGIWSGLAHPVIIDITRAKWTLPTTISVLILSECESPAS